MTTERREATEADDLERLIERLHARRGCLHAMPCKAAWPADTLRWCTGCDFGRAADAFTLLRDRLTRERMLFASENARAEAAESRLAEVERERDSLLMAVKAEYAAREAAERERDEARNELGVYGDIEASLIDQNHAYLKRVVAAEAEVAELRAALEKCAIWFQEYADMHAAKGAIDKAERNRGRASLVRALLAGSTPSGAEHEEAERLEANRQLSQQLLDAHNAESEP